MNIRRPSLQQIIDAARIAIFAARPQGAELVAAEAIFERLTQVSPGSTPNFGPPLPVRKHLPECFALAARGPREVNALAEAMRQLEPETPWARRRDSTPEQVGFYDGHANAILIGPGGLEERTDVLVGASLMGPRLQYPDHSHPPEEIYLAMGAGGWRRSSERWSYPRAGEIFYNTPNVVHAMVTEDQPLLTLWCLLPKDGVLR